MTRTDHPECDGTDAAHPAYWRGHDHAVAVLCQKVNEILDGKDDGKGIASEPWEPVRRRLLSILLGTRKVESKLWQAKQALNHIASAPRSSNVSVNSRPVVTLGEYLGLISVAEEVLKALEGGDA